MKKIGFIAICLLIGFSFYACKKACDGCKDKNSLSYNPDVTHDDGSCVYPEQEQRALVLLYIGSGWKSGASYGYSALEYLTQYNNDKVIPVTVPCKGPMINYYLYSGFTSDRDITGSYPVFYIGDVNSSYSAQSDVDAILSKTPVANTNFIVTRSGNKATIKTRTEFFKATSGQYYLSVYILENGLNKKGSPCEDEDFIYDYIIRESATNSAYGELIISGSIAAGKTVDKEYTITLDSEWANIYVTTVIWKHENTSTPNYKFVNAFMK